MVINLIGLCCPAEEERGKRGGVGSTAALGCRATVYFSTKESLFIKTDKLKNTMYLVIIYMIGSNLMPTMS